MCCDTVYYNFLKMSLRAFSTFIIYNALKILCRSAELINAKGLMKDRMILNV